MKSTLNFKSFAAMAIVGLSLVGCGSGSSTTEGGTSGSAANAGTGTSGTGGGGKKLHLAFLTNNVSEYWTYAHRGVDKAVAELGPDVEVEWQSPQGGTAAEQKSIVDNLLAKKIDGLAISPVDPTNQIDLINDASGKTLVFTQDSDAPTSSRACYIGTDNVAAGKLLGEELKKALPKGGKIVFFVGKKDAQNAKDRMDGVAEALKGSNITILDTRTDDADHARAKTNAADTLVKEPDVAALVGIWSYNGPAIYSAVQDAGKLGKVKILCFDNEAETLAGLKKGDITCTIVQDPYQIGYQSIKNMAAYLKGDKSVVPEAKQKIIDAKVIDPSSVTAYEAESNKLLGK